MRIKREKFKETLFLSIQKGDMAYAVIEHYSKYNEPMRIDFYMNELVEFIHELNQLKNDLEIELAKPKKDDDED